MRAITAVAICLLASAGGIAAPPLKDAKVTVTTSYQTSEVTGVEATLMRVGASRTAILALKGQRLATFEVGAAPELVDFTEEKIYRVNPVQQMYTVTSFADARRRVANEYSVFERPMSTELDEDRPTDVGLLLPTQSRSRSKRFDFRVDVTPTGARRFVADVEAREIRVTVTAWEQGKVLDEAGGWMAASTVWVGPRLAAVDDVVAAQRRYATAIAARTFGPVFTPFEMGMSSLFHSRFPEEAAVAARVLAEVGKLDGTVLSSVTTYGIVRNARDMKLLLSRRPVDPPEKIQMVTKMTLEYLSVDGVATDADVTIPATFKLKK